ncbi:MAG TPA: molybdopterin-dependent oxidoreductase [Syntrophomonadaceae bacterium]|nr:molybdopterin-dependent oxidoreductase [Syntrophomonadaceae bacterium]HPU49451.1 molybdopterin-dependent oxidoreductase [Syntrophomonadaceae bacterium]
MSEWKKTGCALCAQNCGLEVLVENNRIVKVRGDKSNPRSQGYICRKGRNIAHFQHHEQRLKYPLKKVNGEFVRISWDQAISEIAARLKEIRDKYGPRSIAYMGGGGQSCHFEAAFGVRLLRGLGSRYHYSALGQELTGHFWVQGRVLGRQYLGTVPDEENADMLVAIGWNGMESHQMPRAPLVLRKFANDPDKILAVIDPRRSETAQIADLHLALRPGTDALLLRAVIAMIIQEGWYNQDYIDQHVSGFQEIWPYLKDFDIASALKVCELEYEQVREFARLMATRKVGLHTDLGILMNRHSTLVSCLVMVLLALCGQIGLPGTNMIPGYFMPLGAHTDERSPKNWKTVTTGIPILMGYAPPNVLPEEIMSDHPERTRALICTQSNPLRSYADTTAYEEAFKQLDLLVTCEISMTETAKLSHYVLPSRSAYESWDSTFFYWTVPGVYFQMRRPVVEPEGEPLEISEIHLRIADALGLIPELPRELYEKAHNRLEYGLELMKYLQAHPEHIAITPFILGKTLGPVLGSTNLAALWGLLQNMPKESRENAARAGFKKGPMMGEEIFQAILDHPEGLWIGKIDPENNFALLKTDDGRVNVYIPEMIEWLKDVTPEKEAEALKLPEDYPLILMAGRHTSMNANSLMRNPAWNEGKRACTLAMHPEDGEKLGLKDGQMARITTEAGSAKIEVEITTEVRPGTVMIPHGFGLEYQGKTYGVNVNRLTKNTHRDPFTATPLHRYVPCRVEAV